MHASLCATGVLAGLQVSVVPGLGSWNFFLMPTPNPGNGQGQRDVQRGMTDQIQLSTTDWVREQTEQILKQGTTDGVQIQDRPVVLFTVTGAKSGQKRYVPLMRVENDGRYAMIGSIGGRPKNPSWVYNLRANPKVAVQDGNKVFELTAREVHGAEREEWWQRATEAYPHYIELQSLTTRKIPVFVLE
jgi:deazaflavin-dependent oxidoreductase (nitroreductase family)